MATTKQLTLAALIAALTITSHAQRQTNTRPNDLAARVRDLDTSLTEAIKGQRGKPDSKVSSMTIQAGAMELQQAIQEYDDAISPSRALYRRAVRLVDMLQEPMD